VRKDGTTFPVEVHGTLFPYQGRPHILAVVRDVSAQVQAHEALERGVAERTRELATLLEVAHTVTSTLELRPLLSLLLDQLHTVIATSGSSLYVVEGDALHMLEHRFPPALPPLESWRRLPLADALFWPTVRAGQPFVIADVHAQTPDAQAYRALFGDRWAAIQPYCRSYLAVPLVHKHRTIGVLVLSHGDAGYFTPHRQRLALALASQAAVAIENARLYEQAQATAALEERQRLSRELHDSVSQALYSIALGARTARALLAQDPARAAEPLDFVLTQADVALAEMRALIFALRPEALAQEGLVATLQQQATVVQARQHLRVEATLGAEPALPLTVKEALARIAQEALHNTVKHAAARTVQLSLRATAHAVVLEIADDGRGFEPTAAYPGHLGLQSMRERVERVGGTLQIASAPGAGTCLRVVVPLNEAASGSAPIIGPPAPAE
jgi:signal transduction histidine kinase